MTYQDDGDLPFSYFPCLLWFGLPSAENIIIRQGYVISYDTLRRVPRWVTHHVTPEYREVPTP